MCVSLGQSVLVVCVWLSRFSAKGVEGGSMTPGGGRFPPLHFGGFFLYPPHEVWKSRVTKCNVARPPCFSREDRATCTKRVSMYDLACTHKSCTLSLRE
mgnify:CR=1 FL=1